MILSGAPAKFPDSQRAYYSWSERKWSSLVERGAVGVITVASSVDERRVPWERMVAMSWTPQMRWLDADGKPQRAFPELKLGFVSIMRQPRACSRMPHRASRTS